MYFVCLTQGIAVEVSENFLCQRTARSE